MNKKIRFLAALALASAGTHAMADITIGVCISLTGPTSALGIPTKNGIELWPKTIGGEKVNIIMLDDATDPTIAVKNARRFITEDHVDVIVGSVATPVAAAMADVAAEGQTVQLMLSPVNLPEGKGAYSFRLPQSTAVMAIPIVDYWKKTGVKTYGFLGYADAYGEAWLKDLSALADKAGIKMVANERFARSDTSVTGQALKLVSANPDAILIAASGSGAAMPHKGLVERGYAKAKIFQTHGAASRDLIRIGGADVEGSFVSSRAGGRREPAARQQRQQGACDQVHDRLRKGLRQGQREPVRRARVRRGRGAREGRAARVEERQARHQGIPRRPEGSARDDGPHAGFARRAELHRHRPLRLHARDRRAADDRERRMEARTDQVI